MLHMLQNNSIDFQRVSRRDADSMQHERNMRGRVAMSTDLVGWDSYEWAGLDRQRAVEMFEEQIGYAVLMDEETVTIPIFAAKVLLVCARDGQHKREGRRRPRDTQHARLAKLAAVHWARRRKAELVAGGIKATGANSAEDQAAEEARELLSKRGVKLKVETIRRRMQSKKI
jgi:hypothetical protein